MMRPWPALAALAALAMALAAPAAAQEQSSPFSEAERTALHAEIRAYLLEHPELLLEVIQKLEAQQQAEMAASDEALVAANAEALFDDGFSHVAGNPDGDLTIVEFLDYQCGYCRRAHPEVGELVAADGDIRLVVKEMPILGPGSELAARAALATLIAEGPEAYETLHDRLMRLDGQVDDIRLDALLAELGHDPAAIREGMDAPEVDRRLAETRALAESLAITGTPTFVIGDRMLRGYLPLQAMQAMVAEVRAAAE
jgi:protein-disulfide isomerase